MSNINLFPELDNEQEQEQKYNNIPNEYKEEELIVFGYSCKLFRDDFSAKAIDRGQSLIPWNGDENIMIDRYDCRGHLYDLTLWDSDLLRNKNIIKEENCLNDEEKCIEEECDQERYLELYRDIEKETAQQEEELKRLNTDKHAYKQVGFTYDTANNSKEPSSKTTEEVPQPLDDDEYEPFYPSEKLQIPYGMDIPESIKLNAVIEKTASFVSISGVQMEIVLKTKQAKNSQFDFLKYDHYLNPYYRHLIIMIKSGKYRPNVDNNNSNTNNQKKKSSKNGIDQNSSHDDEDESNDSYLHPLLRGSSNNENNHSKKSDEILRTPSVPMNIHNTAYGQLIKKYEHLRQLEKIAKENEEDKMSPKSEEIKNEESSPKSESSFSTNVIPPPPDVKPIIDKLAEYVARNGTAFEQSIRTKNDPRFGFLERDHIHYNYYQLKVQLCAQNIQRNKIEENQRCLDKNEKERVHGKGVKLVLKTNTEESLTPTSCREFNSDDDSNSMPQNEHDDNGEFIGPRPPSPEFLEKMRKQEQRRDRISGFVRDKIVRDKQEERKRKAEMLVQQLKIKTDDSSSSSSTAPFNSTESTSNSTINPILVEKLLNVKSERSSTSIITSPHQYHHPRSTSKSRNHTKYYRRSRSRSNHRRQRRSSHKRSRTRSKSRNRHHSKKSKNSKSSKSSRDHRRHRHRHHRHSSSTSNSSSVSRSSSTSSSSSHEKKKKKKVTKNGDEQRQNQPKKNPQSTKWDQREPTKIKIETPSTETTVATSSLSMSTDTTLSNSTS